MIRMWGMWMDRRMKLIEKLNNDVGEWVDRKVHMEGGC